MITPCLLVAACGPPADVDWPVNGGVDNVRYSLLTEITKDNVGQIEVVWTYDSFQGSEKQSNSIVVDGALYATTPTLKVIARRWDHDESHHAEYRKAAERAQEEENVRHLGVPSYQNRSQEIIDNA